MSIEENDVQVKQEMDDILNLDAPKVGEDIEEEGKTPEVLAEEKEEELPKEELPKEEPPREEPKEPSPADLTAQENERLRQELNELARRAGVQPKEAPAETLPPKTESTADVQFLTDEEADAIIDDPKGLNKILNKVFQAGREVTLRDMPALVRQHALMELNIQQKIQGFWAENGDLAQYKDFCSMVASQVETENPGFAFDEVLTKTAEVARKRLNLPEKGKESAEASPQEEKPSDAPALPAGPRAARRPAPAPKPSDGQQAEMEALATTFNV